MAKLDQPKSVRESEHSLDKKHISLLKILLISAFLYLYKDFLISNTLQDIGFSLYSSKKIAYIIFSIIFLLFSYYIFQLDDSLSFNLIKKSFQPLKLKYILYLFIFSILVTFLLTGTYALQGFIFFILGFETVFLTPLHDIEIATNYKLGSLDFSNLLFIIVNLLLVPLCEEVFFRGIIFQRLLLKYGFIISLVISSILFAVSHDQHQYFSIFLDGLLWGYIYYKTGNLTILVALHSLSNLITWLFEGFGILVLVNEPNILNTFNPQAWIVELLFTPIIIILLYYCIIKITKTDRLSKT